jgi:hypothetical protein
MKPLSASRRSRRVLPATYILPIRRGACGDVGELADYLGWLQSQLDVLIVDGSPPEVFAYHAAHWPASITHLPPDPELQTPNGKVGGVLTGVRHARHERIVLADDDVRYDRAALHRVLALLDTHDVVRPQNYFAPLPWHARWDTARTLLNRMAGGDWPGTFGVRRSTLCATNGYAGDVLFENFEMVRTIKAAGGSETVPLDLLVRRLPPTAGHFWGQRVRQSYDELARPWRFAVFLALVPLALLAVVGRRSRALLLAAAAAVGVAEAGRWRAGGRQAFPFSASLLAPAWLLERGVCTWAALWVRLVRGGVGYRGRVLRRAATSDRVLRRQHAGKVRNDIGACCTGVPLIRNAETGAPLR